MSDYSFQEFVDGLAMPFSMPETTTAADDLCVAYPGIDWAKIESEALAEVDAMYPTYQPEQPNSTDPVLDFQSFMSPTPGTWDEDTIALLNQQIAFELETQAGSQPQLAMAQQPIQSQQIVPTQQPEVATASAPAPANAPTTVPATAPTTAPATAPTTAPTTRRKPLRMGAVYLFENNVRSNPYFSKNGIASWRKVGEMISRGKQARKDQRFIWQQVSWDKMLSIMGKQDFCAYYYEQLKVAKRHGAMLPVLPAWIITYAFGGKHPEQSPFNDHVVAKHLLTRGNKTSKSSVAQGKGKARMHPYNRTPTTLAA